MEVSPPTSMRLLTSSPTQRTTYVDGQRVYEAYDVETPGTAVVIKDSWVDADRPKEADTLSEILDDASDDEKMTVLLHGVVIIDGREDLTRDLLMDGYLVSTSDDDSILETKAWA